MQDKEYTYISDILNEKFTKKIVKIRGWLHGKRSSGGICFLILRDGTGLLQCTIRKNDLPAIYNNIEKLPIESTLSIIGQVQKDERARGGYEVTVNELEILHKANDDYPIAKKYHGPEFLLDHRYVYIRNEKLRAVLTIRATLLDAARTWFKENRYTEVHMPILITAACEGGSTLFEIKYFDKKAYLTQSWQLYAEAVIASLDKIYTIAPSFRAEKSRTRRHLTEYWHLEVEAPWIELKDIIQVQEQLLSYICQRIAVERKNELKLLGREPSDLLKINPPFQKITYDEALNKLNQEGIDLPWGDDLGWDTEKYLANMFHEPFFVTHYPKSAKAFYHKPDPDRSNVTLSADLLAPEGYGEITGGGQRIDNIDQLIQRIEEEKLKLEDYQWYIDLRKYGSVTHSGFGMGIERAVTWIAKLDHIRDSIAFPRLINRVYP